jgi:hypothetical protein
MPGATEYARDPVSVLFDRGARRLLERAYANPGTWAGTRLADPTPRDRLRLYGMGVTDPMGPDNASTHGGRGLNARTRWMRGFVRALYYQHKWFSVQGGQSWRPGRRTVARSAGALEIEIGRIMPVRGVIPRGRAIRVRIRPGGQARLRAVQRLPDRDRIWTDQGEQAARFSDPALRDWQPQ